MFLDRSLPLSMLLSQEAAFRRYVPVVLALVADGE